MPPWSGAVPHYRPIHPIAAICIVFAIHCVLLAVLKIYRRRFNPDPEYLRKVPHIAMGLVTLTFPWLFAETWPVVVLTAAAGLLLVIVKAPGPLRTLMGEVVDGVKRDSLGDVYFPIAVAVLFWLTNNGDPAKRILYYVPILLLTLADAAAALIGKRFGRRRFSTRDGSKSLEGSLACLIVAFLCIYVPLAISYREQIHNLLIAALTAQLVTVLEAVAWRGLDNLFIPFGAYLALRMYNSIGNSAIVAHLAVFDLLAFAAILWLRRG